jgi:hypothetical protein
MQDFLTLLFCVYEEKVFSTRSQQPAVSDLPPTYCLRHVPSHYVLSLWRVERVFVGSLSAI